MSKESPTLQELLERDAGKIAELKRGREKQKVEPEWLLLAELGKFFGWQAIIDAREDRISFAEMNKLLAAARYLESTSRYSNVVDSYSAIISPHDKGKALKSTLKGIKDSWQKQQ